MSKLLVVVGATGQQGGSIIDTVLSDPELSREYTIRGTTRDPNSPSAQTLAAKGIEVVPADFNDPFSLQHAFTGAHTVFATTTTIYDGHTYEHEIAHGRALADAAVAAHVPFYIFSTLPHIKTLSHGTLTHAGHFDAKADVQTYIQTLPLKSAFIAPGSFMSNFHHSMAPYPVDSDSKTYALSSFVPPDTQLPLINTAGDTGKWVAAMLADFDKYEGKVLCCASGLYSFTEIVETMSRVSGKTVVYRQLEEEVWRGFLPGTMVDYIADMMKAMRDFGYFGDGTGEKVDWAVGEARGRVTSLEEFLRERPLGL
ncbi:hscarg dehydrogenase [Aspergillus heteromorphus CBS 117.55]|uniref:Hscarg dehydrogenase n=1 Tax=Aspergillus heteromorphus CBS 117.55 TaxID=1448321 RepID=A0A317W0Q4_9EURO|nr:hscarg dehydrogenase [Aspergillus heteromorphus CBS 117.55]PWY79191.1 hscarg dehydrogenase [Aspergillus heteromorphus CBS 117.55]